MELTLETVDTLSDEQLSEIVYEMYKCVHGVRPRWMSTREDYLGFLKYELRPEVIAQRQQEWKEEAEYYARLEAEEAAQEQLTLPLGDEKYEPVNGSVLGVRIH